MQQSQLPYCVQIIQALGPTVVSIVVGLIASYIACQQWQTTKKKLKLDMFQKRYEALMVIRKIFQLRLSRDEQNYNAEYAKFMDRRLLFPKEIEKQVEDFARLGDTGGNATEMERRTATAISSVEDFIRIHWRN